MIPKATVHFDGPRDEPYEGKVIVRHAWIYLVEEHEIYPSDKVQKIEMHEMDLEMDNPLEKLKNQFDW